MTTRTLLGSQKIMAIIGACDPGRAKAFYRDSLGLRFVSEDSFAVVFDADGIMLRISIVKQMTPAQHTVLGWQVPDVAATARELQAAGVKFELYPGMNQDELGIWTAPGGKQVAWFKDPDGNVLSISKLA
jgi:catechol 2,3-dioxygenase-like lactoylglutathione lyase family enzyme